MSGLVLADDFFTGGKVISTVVLSLFAIIALVGLFYFARVWRRRLSEVHAPEGFSLDDLRQMRERGEIDAVEFEALKQSLIAGIRAKSAKPPAET